MEDVIDFEIYFFMVVLKGFALDAERRRVIKENS